MRLKQNQRKRLFWGLVAAFVLLSALCLSLSSCHLASSSAQTNDVSKDTYEAKLVYYETQLQTLREELKKTEDQMTLLRQEYVINLERLEDRIAAAQGQETTQEPPQQLSPQPSAPTQGEGMEHVRLCDYSYRLEGESAIITGYLGDERNVVVPAAVDGFVVIGLDDSAFADTSVRCITLPETVKSIGWFTFFGCQHLEQVTLPASLCSIGYASFDGCAAALCLFVPENSYAEQYALSFGLKFQTTT